MTRSHTTPPGSEAIAPLLRIARTLRTTAERDALAVYVIRKIAGSR